MFITPGARSHPVWHSVGAAPSRSSRPTCERYASVRRRWSRTFAMRRLSAVSAACAVSWRESSSRARILRQLPMDVALRESCGSVVCAWLNMLDLGAGGHQRFIHRTWFFCVSGARLPRLGLPWRNCIGQATMPRCVELVCGGEEWARRDDRHRCQQHGTWHRTTNTHDQPPHHEYNDARIVSRYPRINGIDLENRCLARARCRVGARHDEPSGTQPLDIDVDRVRRFASIVGVQPRYVGKRHGT